MTSETGTEIGKVVEGKVAQAQQNLVAGVDALLKNAPEGSEAAVAVIKNAIETAQSSAKKAFEFAEKNVSNVANASVKAVKTAAKAK